MFSMLNSRRALFLLLGLSGLVFFLSGVVLGNLMHLAACPLCIIQRMLYMVFGVLGVCGALVARNRLFSMLFNVLLVPVSATGAFVAGYQSWIQHHPEAPSCVADSPWWETFVYWAGEKAPSLFLSSGMCSDPGFKLFGLSIAEYSLLCFSALLLLALFLFSRRA